MDKFNLDQLVEIESQLNNKRILSSGYIYEMFGAKYIAISNTEGENPCERCAFADCNCMFNADVPACYNNVHFEVIKDIKFGIYDICGDLIAIVKNISNNEVETECGKKFNLKSLYMHDFHIKPTLIK